MEEKNLDENKEEVTEEVPEVKPASPTGLSVIEEARREREELQKQLDRKEELLNREEALEADRQLGGRAEAGVQAEKKKPETDEEFSKRFTDGEVDLFK